MPNMPLSKTSEATRVILELFMEPEMKEMLERIEKGIIEETGFVIPRKQITRKIYLEGARALGHKFGLNFEVKIV